MQGVSEKGIWCHPYFLGTWRDDESEGIFLSVYLRDDWVVFTKKNVMFSWCHWWDHSATDVNFE